MLEARNSEPIADTTAELRRELILELATLMSESSQTARDALLRRITTHRQELVYVLEWLAQIPDDRFDGFVERLRSRQTVRLVTKPRQ